MTRAHLMGAALAMAVLTPAAPTMHASGAPATVLYEWNQVIQDTVPVPHGVLTPRFFALAHIAMFDAVNAIEREYAPYRVSVRFPALGSAEAAAAQAAHDVLVAIHPAAQATYDATLARQLGGRPSVHARRGAALGARVAAAILDWRKNDGWVVPVFPPYSEPPVPGRWQPTTPGSAAAFTHLQNAAPLALVSPTQYLPAPPPPLHSAAYVAALNEVALIGRSDSATRTPEQTAIARLWAGIATTGSGSATNFMSIWNSIARDVSRTRRLSLVDSARVFALMNVSVHDALQTAQASKFVYGLWRPMTAIRQADPTLSPGAIPDPSWTPLLATPPYPSYGGNMATIGSSAARALQLAFGTDDIAVRGTWKQSGGAPDVNYDFDGFWQVAEQQTESRVYGGIHYRFDSTAAHQIGTSTAEYVFATYMTARDRRRD